MRTFLHIGTNYIFPEIIFPIRNTNGSKPNGGLWATVQDKDINNFNPWIEFLRFHPHILFYKYTNPFQIPATLITLKESANIFSVKNINELNFLKTYYKDNKGWIDFEALTKDFEGLLIDIDSLLTQNIDDDIKIKLLEFGVSSLILFNLDSIAYYQQAQIDIAPYDYEYEKEFTNYKIIYSTTRLSIPSPVDCTVLINKIKNYIHQSGLSDTDKQIYNQISNAFNQELSKIIKEITNGHQTDNPQIKKNLIRRAIQSI